LAPVTVLMLAVVAIGFWPGMMDWITGPAASALVSTLTGGMTAN
jgi:hypothetical protein